MIVKMRQEFRSRLAGKLPGKRDYARLCELLAKVTPGSIVLLDFSGVVAVSASWINAALVPLLTWAKDERNDVFPAICKAKDDWLDELALVANYTHTCFLIADASIPPRRASLVGTLDPTQQSTLKAVVELEAATGAELNRRRPNEPVEATAWNNRLKDLYDRRLLRRERRGRQQVYRPVVKEISVCG